MRGRQVFMDSLRAHGARAIFGNPGTTENPVLDSLIDYPEIGYYVALHEGVAVCAAGFYAQASGSTAVANVHVAPGLGNAIGMMYGALKACAPVIVTAGQQDTRMRLRDPVLRHDLVAMASPVCKWAVEPQSADEMALIMRRAFKIANEPPAGPVFVALPVNVMEQETDLGAETSGLVYRHTLPDPEGVRRLAELLAAARNPALVAGDEVAVQGAGRQLTALAERCGAAVYVEFLRSRQPLTFGHPCFQGRVPYEVAKIRELFAPHDLVVLFGGPFFEEVWFDEGAFMPPDTIVAQVESAPSRLAHNFSLDLGLTGYLPSTFDALNEALDRAAGADFVAASQARLATLTAARERTAAAFAGQLERAASDSGVMTSAQVMDTVSRAMPADAVLVDESITGSIDLSNAHTSRDADNFFGFRGGGIGQGIAGALGVAVAHPERRVVAQSGDGSAMYSIQALWTAAHHGLKLVFVILSNREYRVLKHNLDIYRQRFNAISDKPYPHMDLTRPGLGFVEMAAGMGVPAQQVETVEALKAALATAFASDGPYLIDAVIAGKPG